MTGFSSLNTAVTGLYAAQRAMDVTGQNIVNANTPGYSRQRVTLSEIGSGSSSSLFTGGGTSNAGVSVAGVARIRDVFVEAARVAAGGRQAALTSQTSTLSGVQQLFAEPGDTGLQSTMDAFYSAWHDLANHPTDVAAGSVVIQRGIAVTDQLHSLSNGIAGQWSIAHDALADTLSQANQAAKDLADVNAKVSAGLVAGRPVNELMDQRDTLARTLGTLLGGTSSVGADGQASISIGGVAMVSGSIAQQFTLSGATSPGGAAASPPTLMWGTTSVPVASGTAAGYLAVLGTDLPALAARVDGVATSLRDLVNGVHQNGFQADGTPGGLFFDGTGAASLVVVPTAPAQLAVTQAPGTIDGANAMAIGDLSDDQVAATTLGHDGPSAQWRDLTTLVGVRVQSLKNASTVQDAVLSAADAAVQSDSGVNIDEEMTNLLQYQRAYQASARLITTIDEVFDTLVNRTGTVGR